MAWFSPCKMTKWSLHLYSSSDQVITIISIFILRLLANEFCRVYDLLEYTMEKKFVFNSIMLDINHWRIYRENRMMLGSKHRVSTSPFYSTLKNSYFVVSDCLLFKNCWFYPLYFLGNYRIWSIMSQALSEIKELLEV